MSSWSIPRLVSSTHAAQSPSGSSTKIAVSHFLQTLNTRAIAWDLLLRLPDVLRKILSTITLVILKLSAVTLARHPLARLRYGRSLPVVRFDNGGEIGRT